MSPAERWRPMADRPYRDRLVCACGTIKPPGVSPIGWTKRFDLKLVRTRYRCPDARPKP